MKKKVIQVDADNNFLLVKTDKVKDKFSHKVYLKLKDKHERHIADIKVISGEYSLFIQRKRDKHLFQKNNSYGFNYIFIQNSLEVKIKYVLLLDELGAYLFPLSLIKEKGTYLHFQKEGFEKQIFLSLDEIQKYEVNATEYVSQ